MRQGREGREKQGEDEDCGKGCGEGWTCPEGVTEREAEAGAEVKVALSSLGMRRQGWIEFGTPG